MPAASKRFAFFDFSGNRFSGKRLWLLFWIGLVLLYLPAWQGGFERDFHGWLEMYRDLPFVDVMNRKGAGIQSLYQVTQFQLYVWTALFGHHFIPWYLIMTGLVSAAAAAMVSFLRQYWGDFALTEDARRRGQRAALWGGIFLLAMPSLAEVVVWKASYHYPVAFVLIFSILALVRDYVTGRRGPGALWGAIGLYILSNFTVELFYLTLPLLVLMLWGEYRRPNADARRIRGAWIGVAAPFLGFFLLHFALFRWYANGLVVPHIQRHIELSLQQPLVMFGRLFQLQNHLLLSGRYWPQSWHQRVYEAAATPVAGWLALVAIGVAAGLVFRNLARGKGAQVPLAFLGAGALGSLLLVLPSTVDSYDLLHNDRLLYGLAIFQWPIIAWVLLRGARNRVDAAMLTAFGLVLTFYTALEYRRAAQGFWQVIERFPKQLADKPVWLLNVPANIHGIVQLQEGPSNQEFNSHLRTFTGSGVPYPIRSIAGFNGRDPNAGARVLVEDRTHLYVTLLQPNTWLFNGELGAANYETAQYRFTMDEWAHQYYLELKDTNARLLYYTHGWWKEVDFGIRGQDQE